jgi:hypothetical protein
MNEKQKQEFIEKSRILMRGYIKGIKAAGISKEESLEMLKNAYGTKESHSETFDTEGRYLWENDWSETYDADAYWDIILQGPIIE